MSTNVQMSNGSTFKASGTAIAEVIDINGPNRKRKVVNVTTLSDTTTIKKVGRPDSGEVTLTCGSTSTNFGTVCGYFDGGTTIAFVITDIDSKTESFSGYVTGVNRKFTDDDKVTFDMSVEVTGAITLA